MGLAPHGARQARIEDSVDVLQRTFAPKYHNLGARIGHANESMGSGRPDHHAVLVVAEERERRDGRLLVKGPCWGELELVA